MVVLATMTDILLAHAYYLNLDSKQQVKMRPYPPLATLYAASVLREHGYDVAVFDAMMATNEDDFAIALAVHQPRAVVLFEDNFNFLSKMCLARMREAALTMLKMALASDCHVAMSGADVTDHPEVYLAAGASICLIGEGEHSVVEIVDRWFGRSDGSEPVAGSATLIDGVIANSGRRAIERHPDVFGEPARDLVDIAHYRDVWLAHHGEFSLNMVSTRGCPYRCNWCAKPIWGQRYSMRTAVAVADEMTMLKRVYAPDHIWFADDIFGLRSDWLAKFADQVEDNDGAIPFTIQSRCDLMNEQAVDALARSGCREVWLGAESGSQHVLDAMDKDITVEQIHDARRRLASKGIRACFFIQFGYPGETWADIRLTIEMIRELLPDDIGVSVSYPLPGTKFHEMVKLDLTDQGHWQDSGDLAMMFAGTYRTNFYRELHHSLHDDLDLRRRMAGLSRAPHALLEDIPLELHQDRVAARWLALEASEPAARNPYPTRRRIAVFAESMSPAS
jgi:anaerobic magnesium-protoporphyrin IX monomethyl ester cyclase